MSGRIRVARRNFEHAEVLQMGSVVARKRKARTIEDSNLKGVNEICIGYEGENENT